MQPKSCLMCVQVSTHRTRCCGGHHETCCSNCNASESAPPGTYAAIAVVILASVCHCATTVLSWREGLMQRCCTGRTCLLQANAAASACIQCSVNVACDHGFVGSIDRAQTSLRQCCSV
jgi:hypothetical protein